MSLYDTLNVVLNSKLDCSQCLYHCYHNPAFTKKCLFIIRLLLQVGRLYIKKCKLCFNSYSITHILFECTETEEYRMNLWNNIYLPNNFNNSLQLLNNYKKTDFMLNAFYIKYTREWSSIYSSIAYYIYYTIVSHDKLCSE